MVGVNTVTDIAVSVWALSNIFTYKERYLNTVDFETLKTMNEIFKFSYTGSTFWFDASKTVFGLLLFVTAINVANMVWKIALMKEEDRLLKNSREERLV